MDEQRNHLRWLLTAFAVVVMADQITKAIVLAMLDVGTPYRPDTFFYFTHQRNEGLVGGAFAGMKLITYTAPIVATLVLIYLYRHLSADSRLQHVAYGMVLGGALGNFIDRLRLGSVTDFIQVHFYFIPFDFPWKFYPAFNLADSAIVIGVFILVLTWGREATADAASTT